ncbi:uncharacterized protein LOC131163398 [Malania oleifera]|uniref:uncharacterized protein LOC131163398 n=1 Tax=Malania oleifera TaxID=397392 RepID=UPI0025AE934C|nr:uncharacterized protein LOC131163398 [Malania oleifera]
MDPRNNNTNAESSGNVGASSIDGSDLEQVLRSASQQVMTGIVWNYRGQNCPPADPSYTIEQFTYMNPLTFTEGADQIIAKEWIQEMKSILKEVVFKPPEEQEYRFVGTSVRTPPPILSVIQARRLLQEGCQGYLVCVKEALEGELRLKDILIVRDFPDVFLEDLSGLPPDCEMKFAIDLSPETALISKAPYRKAPAELKELKERL